MMIYPSRLFLLLLLPGMVYTLPVPAASVYQWRDANGDMHYSDIPPVSWPLPQRAIRPNVVDTGNNAAAVAQSVIKLYVADSCPPCSAARDLLDNSKVPYELHSISGSQQEVLAFYKLTGETSSPLPVLAVGQEVYKGWDLALWQAALSKAGYITSTSAPAAP